jgi:pyruvate formate lyase activating enzyme
MERMMDRRDFIKCSGCLSLLSGLDVGLCAAAGASNAKSPFVKKAAWYNKLAERKVECRLCPRHCQVADQETGWCGVRANHNGEYFTHVFGRPVSIANDPIEKKPLFHFKPGSKALSLSTVGCNFECKFCQNWQLSQFRPEQIPHRFGFVRPQAILRTAHARESESIAFTYAEPVVFFEYALAIARLSKKAKLPAIMISNGYIDPEPMEELLDQLEAVKIDFKAYSDGFYRTWCRGQIKPVLKTMELVRKKGVWLEMVHLTIPSLNDSTQETQALCQWVMDNLGPDVPLHFTRFQPTYKLKNIPATPRATLERQWEIAKKTGLHYPYVGNLAGHPGENTHCHHCGQLLIRRVGFTPVENNLIAGTCKHCNKAIPGMW